MVCEVKMILLWGSGSYMQSYPSDRLGGRWLVGVEGLIQYPQLLKFTSSKHFL